MRVLVTGHDGYIGTVMVPALLSEGHEVVGLDTFFYRECSFAADAAKIPALSKDVRDVEASDLEGFDAIVHLAAISNDPVGDLNPECTLDINYRGSVRLARLAKLARVPRFLFSSSCSLYGAAAGRLLDEDAPFRPVTAYGRSKVLAERDIAKLADDTFSPTFLRNSTVYGVSPRLRGDLAVNNLVGYAVTTGEVRLMSDGTPWRPFVHVTDVCRAFVTLLGAPPDIVHNEAFNVGSTSENYRIRDVAEIVREVVPGSRVAFSDGAGPDPRDYRVSFDKLSAALPDFRLSWTLRRGVEELFEFFTRSGLTLADLTGPRAQRIGRIRQLMSEGHISSELRWLSPIPTSSGERQAGRSPQPRACTRG
jgi:nucleoside-diphosphate-sugar epimerase